MHDETRPLAELLRDASISQEETSESLESAHRAAINENPVATEHLLLLMLESRRLQATLARLSSLANTHMGLRS